MFDGNTIRSFELPVSLETTIDTFIRIFFVAKGIQWAWKRRMCIHRSVSFTFWFTVFMSFPVFYELSSVAKKLHLEKQSEFLRSVSINCFVSGSNNMGMGDEILLTTIFGILGNDKSYEKTRRLAMSGLVMYLFAKGLSAVQEKHL